VIDNRESGIGSRESHRTRVTPIPDSRLPKQNSADLRDDVDERRLARWLKRFAGDFDHRRRNTKIVLRGLRPHTTRAETGLRLHRWSTRTRLKSELLAHDRGPVLLGARIVRPGVTRGDVGPAIVAHPGVVETHDLHVWTVTDGFPALSAHVLVQPGADCHRIRLELETLLHERFGIDHTTLQVEHIGTARGLEITRAGSGGSDLLA